MRKTPLVLFSSILASSAALAQPTNAPSQQAPASGPQTTTQPQNGALQKPEAQSANGTAMPQAPVGHRQPTPSDLPPAVRQEEKSFGSHH